MYKIAKVLAVGMIQLQIKTAHVSSYTIDDPVIHSKMRNEQGGWRKY